MSYQGASDVRFKVGNLTRAGDRFDSTRGNQSQIARAGRFTALLSLCHFSVIKSDSHETYDLMTHFPKYGLKGTR
jgi:hypothetical protein